jgi:hypothetical protein
MKRPLERHVVRPFPEGDKMSAEDVAALLLFAGEAKLMARFSVFDRG